MMRLALLQLRRLQTGWYIRQWHSLRLRPTDTKAGQGIVCHPFTTVSQGSDVTYEGAKHNHLGESEQVIGPWIPMIALVRSRLEYGQELIDTWVSYPTGLCR
jgi:hypothetical protein